MYQIFNDLRTGAQMAIVRIADNAFIPFDPQNTDYQAYLKFLAEGGQPLPADEEVPVINTPLPADE
jgi:hypothetical protein